MWLLPKATGGEMTPEQQYLADCLHAAEHLIRKRVSDEFLTIAWNAYMVPLGSTWNDAMSDSPTPSGLSESGEGEEGR